MTQRHVAEPVLCYRNASISLDGHNGFRTLVSGLDLDVNVREIVAVVGESGSGKTLTGLSVLGLLPPGLTFRADRATLNGRDLTQCTERDWRALRGSEAAMVFQEPLSSLNPVLTIGNQITEILKYKTDLPRRARRDHAAQLLRDVDIPRIPQVLDDFPHQLSGGMRQRVMLAMAMAANPALLIADEPTTALDNTVQRQVLELIARTAERSGVAVLFVTHDLSVVANLADRVVVMNQGLTVETGAVEQIFRAPAHDYTRKLISLAPRRPAPLPVSAADRARSRVTPRSDAPLALVHPGGATRSMTSAIALDEPLLRVEGVSKRFDCNRRSDGVSVAALSQVSVELRPGSTLGVVGESGSGKSTLARVITGLIQPDAGRVWFQGRDLVASDRAGTRRGRDIQMVFQDPFASLNPRMRIADIVTEPMRACGMVDARGVRQAAQALLDAVGLPADAVARWPHELSGGQRQRVGIARALSSRPRLVVCDEPVSALDASVQAQVLALLKRLQPEFGLSYVFIAHGLDSVYAISDTIAVMQAGRIVEQGARDQIFHDPQHPYTRKLLDAMLDSDPQHRLFRTLRAA